MGFMKRWTLYARVIVTIAICVLIVRFIDWNTLSNTLQEAKGNWIAAFILIHVVDRLFMAYKWRLLLRESGVSVSGVNTIKAYYIGSFWSYFLPSSIGGDAIRASWLMKKRGGGGAIILSSIVIERLLGSVASAIVALGSVGLLVVHFQSGLPGLSIGVGVFLIGSIMALTVVFNESAHDMFHKCLSYLPFERISQGMQKMKDAIFAFKRKPGILGRFLMLSIIEQGFAVIGMFAVAKALSIDLSMMWCVMGVPLISLVTKMPISVKGIGVYEGTSAFVFSFAGLPVSVSVLMALVDRVLSLLATLPGALWTVYGSEGDVSIHAIVEHPRPLEENKKFHAAP